jgi:hypothetical protein
MGLAGVFARGRQESGAGKIMSLATSARDAAVALRDLPHLRAYAVSAAESLEGLADYVMHTDIERMAGDASNFARRHPLAAFGIAVGAGLAVSQYIRPRSRSTAASSARRTRTTGTAATRRRKQPAQSRGKANGHASAHV